MKVHFGQIYVEPGVSFPFSFQFQRRLSDAIGALISPSTEFVQQYGDDYELIFRISAKRGICDNEIRGPSVFKKSMHIEFTVFLPFDVIQHEVAFSQSAIRFLLQGVCSVLDALGIDSSKLLASMTTLVKIISSNPTMFKPNNHKTG